MRDCIQCDAHDTDMRPRIDLDRKNTKGQNDAPSQHICRRCNDLTFSQAKIWTNQIRLPQTMREKTVQLAPIGGQSLCEQIEESDTRATRVVRTRRHQRQLATKHLHDTGDKPAPTQTSAPRRSPDLANSITATQALFTRASQDGRPQTDE